MAAKEMYDYLTTIAADVDQTLTIKAQPVITEGGSFHQEIHRGDDGSEERVNYSTTPEFYAAFDRKLLTESESGTVFELYFDTAKACGTTNSFKWSGRNDGHTYVVRFDMKFERFGNNQARLGIKIVRLRILGRIADA